MGNALYTIIWLLVLIFISFWVAGFCAGFYIILYPFNACGDCLVPVTDILLKGIQFPYYCAVGMMEGRALG